MILLYAKQETSKKKNVKPKENIYTQQPGKKFYLHEMASGGQRKNWYSSSHEKWKMHQVLTFRSNLDSFLFISLVLFSFFSIFFLRHTNGWARLAFDQQRNLAYITASNGKNGMTKKKENDFAYLREGHMRCGAYGEHNPGI